MVTRYLESTSGYLRAGKAGRGLWRQRAGWIVGSTLLLAACNTTGAGCLVYGQHRSSVPPSPEFAVLDTAMTEACRP